MRSWASILNKKAEGRITDHIWLVESQIPTVVAAVLGIQIPLGAEDSSPVLGHTPGAEPPALGCPDATDQLCGWLSWVSRQSSHPAWGATLASGSPSGDLGSRWALNTAHPLQPSPLPSLATGVTLRRHHTTPLAP